MDSRRANHLTMIGMLLTVTVSVGGAWVSNRVATGINETQIQSLLLADEESSKVNKIVYKLVSKMESATARQDKTDEALIAMDKQLDNVEINAARSTEAIENLVTATQVLAETNNRLIIAVAKLEK